MGIWGKDASQAPLMAAGAVSGKDWELMWMLLKPIRFGMVPPAAQKIYQIGNTSLALARQLIRQPERLDELQDLANKLRARHCMFGPSKDFANAYLLELSF